MKEYLESYSNLAYNIVGLVGYFVYGDTQFCWAMNALGVGSFLYHYYKTKPIYLMDWWAMCFVMNVITTNIVTIEWVQVLIFSYHILYGFVLIRLIPNVFIQVGMSALPCLIAIFIFHPLGVFAEVSILFLLAFWVRSKDKDPKQLIFHDSTYHSLWHLLTAPIFFMGNFGVSIIL